MPSTAKVPGSTVPLEYHIHDEGKSRRFYIVTDPRLPFVDYYVPQTNPRAFDKERNEAIYDSHNGKKPAALNELAEQVESIPWWPIENGHYAHDALSRMPGISITQQDKGNRSVRRYFAFTEAHYNIATGHVRQHSGATAEQLKELRAAIATVKPIYFGDVEDDLTERQSAFVDEVEDTFEAFDGLETLMDEGLLSRPQAERLLTFTRDAAPWQAKALSSLIVEGRITEANSPTVFDVIDRKMLDGSPDLIEARLAKAFSNGQALRAIDQGRAFASTDERNRAFELAGGTQRLSEWESERDLLPRGVAKRVIEDHEAKNAAAQVQADEDEDTRAEFREEYWTEAELTMREGYQRKAILDRDGASPSASAQQRLRMAIHAAVGVANQEERITLASGETRTITTPAREEVVPTSAFAMRVFAADRYNVVGWLDDAKTQYVHLARTPLKKAEREALDRAANVTTIDRVLDSKGMSRQDLADKAGLPLARINAASRKGALMAEAEIEAIASTLNTDRDRLFPREQIAAHGFAYTKAAREDMTDYSSRDGEAPVIGKIVRVNRGPDGTQFVDYSDEAKGDSVDVASVLERARYMLGKPAKQIESALAPLRYEATGTCLAAGSRFTAVLVNVADDLGGHPFHGDQAILAVSSDRVTSKKMPPPYLAEVTISPAHELVAASAEPTSATSKARNATRSRR